MVSSPSIPFPEQLLTIRDEWSAYARKEINSAGHSRHEHEFEKEHESWMDHYYRFLTIDELLKLDSLV